MKCISCMNYTLNLSQVCMSLHFLSLLFLILFHVSAGSHATFTTGTWSECHDVLGVADDTGTLYFIKLNGEEITRITRRHLKICMPIVGLIAENDSDEQRSCL